MNVRRALALVALVAIPLASCGSDDPDTGDTSPAATGASTAGATGGTDAGSSAESTTTSSTSTTAAPTTTVDLAASLDGRTFLSTEVVGYQLVDGSQIQLTFDGTNIAAAGGCNQIVVDVVARGRGPGRRPAGDDDDGLRAGGADGPGHVAGGAPHVEADGHGRRGRR